MFYARLMIALVLLAQAVTLHSAWPGPGLPPPEYNAAVGDPIPPNAPEQQWQCTMRHPSKMNPFKVRIAAGKLDRIFPDDLVASGEAHYPMTVLSNSTLGVVAVDYVNDVEDGKAGIGTFTFSMNRITGDATFAATFAGQNHSPPAEGRCIRESP